MEQQNYYYNNLILPPITKEGLELKTHGSVTLPFTVYRGNIPKWLNAYPLHYHIELELIVCREGIGKIQLQGTTYYLEKEDIIVILPEQVHSIEAKDNHFEYYNILFRLSYLETNKDNNTLYLSYLAPFENGQLIISPLLKKGSEMHTLIFPIANLLYGYWRKECPPLLLKSKLYEIMYILHIHAKKPDHKTKVHKANQCLKQTVQYLQEHYNEPIPIKEIAEYCGYSESHFMKVFSQLTEKSFTQYLISFRLEKAAQLLLSSSLSVIEIASECGFPNASYFTRSFRKHYGISPSEYRKSKTKENN